MSILWALSSASVWLGALNGAFFTGLLADTYGRRKALIMISFCGVIGSLFDGYAKLANSFEMFILGKYVIGGGLGCGIALASMFIDEIAPVRHRGACGATQQIMIGFGNALSLGLTLSQVMGTEKWCPIAVSVPPFLASMTQAVALLFYAHDSPRYLILTKSDIQK